MTLGFPVEFLKTFGVTSLPVKTLQTFEIASLGWSHAAARLASHESGCLVVFMDALEKEDQSTPRGGAPVQEVAFEAGSRPVPLD